MSKRINYKYYNFEIHWKLFRTISSYIECFPNFNQTINVLFDYIFNLMNMYMFVDFVCTVCVYVCYIAFNPVPGYKRAIKYILYVNVCGTVKSLAEFLQCIGGKVKETEGLK